MPALPLDGIRVVDLTVVWSGPAAGRYLAALGAEVVRVESIRHFPATSRGQVPYPDRETVARSRDQAAAYPGKDPGTDPYNRFAPFLLTAQGKLSCTMELGEPEGQRAFHRLVEKSDVLIENNSRALGEKLGFTWEALSKINPGLILVRMAPLGLSGPYADAIGFGAHFEAMGGLGYLRGYPGEEPGASGCTYHMDDISPQGVVFAVLAALMHRDRTGLGQQVEFPQGEYLIHGLGDVYLGVASDPGYRPQKDGNRHPKWVQGCYPCAGDDQWLTVTVRDDDDWKTLVKIMGSPPWTADARYATGESRRRHHDDIDRRIAAFTIENDKHELFATLQAAGVPAAPVYQESDAYSDPHFLARGTFRSLTHPRAGVHLYPGFGSRWSGIELAWGRPAPQLGEHNDYVYKELLSYTDEEYAELQRSGMIGTAYPGGYSATARPAGGTEVAMSGPREQSDALLALHEEEN